MTRRQDTVKLFVMGVKTRFVLDASLVLLMMANVPVYIIKLFVMEAILRKFGLGLIR